MKPAFRTYGPAPLRVAVLHGGPGAAGEMAPVAARLAHQIGVLEPLQSADSINGQIAELEGVLCAQAAAPVALVGYSWGAWLAVLFAGTHPGMVNKLILIGSGPFRDADAAVVVARRLERLSTNERKEAQALLVRLESAAAPNDGALARLGDLFTQTDQVAPITAAAADATVAIDSHIFQQVWPAAAALRKSGELLQRAAQIRCPVVVIHGAQDPHPAAGVSEPLAAVLPDFQLVLLERCGTHPGENSMRLNRFMPRFSQHCGSRRYPPGRGWNVSRRARVIFHNAQSWHRGGPQFRYRGGIATR